MGSGAYHIPTNYYTIVFKYFFKALPSNGIFYHHLQELN